MATTGSAPQPTPATPPPAPAPSGSCLVVEGVSVSFGGLVAVDEVSLAIRTGQITSLIGPNGAGKTTLFNVISGFLRPARGRVLLDGEDVTPLSPAQRGRLGVVRTFQHMELFEQLTVLDNLLAARELRQRTPLLSGLFRGRGQPDGSTADAEELLHLVGLERLADRPVVDLPMGMRRLVELARALMVDARVLLLDEPSSGLDLTETRHFTRVVGNVRARNPRLSVLLVEHDMDVAFGLAEYVYVLGSGRLIAQGDPDAVRRDRRVRHAYLGDLG